MGVHERVFLAESNQEETVIITRHLLMEGHRIAAIAVNFFDAAKEAATYGSPYSVAIIDDNIDASSPDGGRGIAAIVSKYAPEAHIVIFSDTKHSISYGDSLVSKIMDGNDPYIDLVNHVTSLPKKEQVRKPVKP